MTDLPILERRRIEAPILRHVHDGIAARSDQTEADAVIGAAVSRSAIEQGRSFAKALGHTPRLRGFRRDHAELDKGRRAAGPGRIETTGQGSTGPVCPGAAWRPGGNRGPQRISPGCLR